MDEECLCLTWNNQGATYKQMLNHLRVEKILTDCTLACDGQKFFVHRLVLVTCSDFFKSLLEDVPCQHPIVYLRGINGQEMQALIDFMYLGMVDVSQRDVSNLISTAEALQIKGLGVLNSHVKDESGHASYKRKRSPLPSSLEALETRSLNERFSSLKAEHSTSEDITSDKSCSSPKKSQREWTRDKINNNSHICSSNTVNIDDDDYTPNKEKEDSFCNMNSRNENTSASLFKSSPIASSTSSIPLSTEFDSTPVPEPSNSALTNRSSPLEGPSLAKLMPLQPFVPEHSRSSDYYANCTEGAPESRLSGTSYYLNQNLKVQEFENLAKVKQEEWGGIDYSQNSAAEKIENSLLASHHPKEPPPREGDNFNRFPKYGTGHLFDKSSRNPDTLHLPHQQDENLENGTESGRPYLCPICHKSFAKVAILKRHHLAHFRPYNCHLCSRSFTRREVLAEHVLEHNGADLRLPCPVCKMTIKRKRNLQAHIKVKHPEYHKQKSSNKEALC